MDFFTSLLWAADKIDPGLAAAIGNKAAEDASIAARYAFYSLVVQSVVPVAVAWIAFKQAALNTSMKHLEKNTNAIKDELVIAVKQGALAEGNLQGRIEQTAETQRRKKERGE